MDRHTIVFDERQTRLPCNASVTVSMTTPALLLLLEVISWLRQMSVAVLNRKEMGFLHKLSVSLIPNDGFVIEKVVDDDDEEVELGPNTVLVFRLLREKKTGPGHPLDVPIKEVQGDMLYLEIVDRDEILSESDTVSYRSAIWVNNLYEKVYTLLPNIPIDAIPVPDQKRIAKPATQPKKDPFRKLPEADPDDDLNDDPFDPFA